MAFDAITIDTQLVRTNDFRFENKQLDVLNAIVDSACPLLLTEVVASELADQLSEKIRQLRSQVKSNLEQCDKFGLIPEGQAPDLIEEDAHLSANRYLQKVFNRLGAIPVPNSKADIDQVWELYRKNSPPFGAEKKRNEFPDAIALNALENYAEERDWEILAISGDKDWLSYSGVSDRITVVKGVPEAVRRIAEDQPQVLAPAVANFIRKLATPGEADQMAFLTAGLDRQLVGYYFPAEAESEWGYDAEASIQEVEDIDIIHSFDEASVSILEVEETSLKAVVILPVDVKFEGHFEFFTIDNEGDQFPRGQATAEMSERIKQEVILTFDYNPEKSEISKLTDVDVISPEGYSVITFGYVSPEIEQPEDWDWSEFEERAAKLSEEDEFPF